MSSGESIYRDIVFLVCYGRDGDVIEETDMSFEEYYDGAPPMIDEDEYRGKRCIRRITGRIYNSAGQLQQEFENQYAIDGRITQSRIVHEDGTVVVHEM